MPCCSAVNCFNRTEKGFKMHSFPRDEARKAVWLLKMNRDNWIPTSSSCLCEAHFDEEQYERYRMDGRKLLKSSAVPTIFSDIKPPIKRRRLKRPSPVNALQTGIQHEHSYSDPTDNLQKIMETSEIKEPSNQIKSEEGIILIKVEQISDEDESLDIKQELLLTSPSSEDDLNDVESFKHVTSDVTGLNSQQQKQRYSCDFCPKSFVHKRTLSHHVEISHDEKSHERKFECLECGKKSTTNSNHQRHLQIHEREKQMTCGECGAKFLRVAQFKNHLSSHHVQNNNNFKCEMCDKIYASRRKLGNHVKKIHTKEISHVCPVCEKEFSNSSYLKDHELTHVTGEKKPYSCTQCPRKFALKDSFRDHLRTHSGDLPYSCSFCDMKFSQKCRLNAHARVHTRPKGEKQYCCTLCSRKFAHKESLGAHLKFHAGEFSCATCEKKFSKRKDLATHSLMHETGEKKPHGCQECGLKFAMRRSLKAHILTHTGAQPYLCHECGKKFTLGDSLKQHLKIHSPEKEHGCQLCEKKFRLNSHLKTHLLKIHKIT